MWADTILIVFISICTALLGEGKKVLLFIVFLGLRLFSYFQITIFTYIEIVYRFNMVNGLQNRKISEVKI